VLHQQAHAGGHLNKNIQDNAMGGAYAPKKVG
jgi:hypothetical protein